MKILFKKNTFILQSDGSLFWEKKKILILGDLHLEKSSYFAKVGNFLPPYDSIHTLQKLKKKLLDLDAKKVILLGDIFHDKYGLKRLKDDAMTTLNYICKKFNVIWIIGNHDGDYAPHNVTIKKNYSYYNISFNHVSNRATKYEISAHYHPKVYLNIRGRKVSSPCFLVDENKIVIPAYGTFTGGLDVNHKDFKKNFSNNFEIYITTNNKIYLLKR